MILHGPKEVKRFTCLGVNDSVQYDDWDDKILVSILKVEQLMLLCSSCTLKMAMCYKLEEHIWEIIIVYSIFTSL